MPIKHIIENSLTNREIATLGIYLGFKPSFYQKAFEYVFHPSKINQKYRLTFEEFQECLKSLKEAKIINSKKGNRDLIRDAWINRTGSEYPSQPHMWAWHEDPFEEERKPITYEEPKYVTASINFKLEKKVEDFPVYGASESDIKAEIIQLIMENIDDKDFIVDFLDFKIVEK